MLDASIGLTERFTPYSISLNDDMDSKKKITLRVSTTTTRTDRCGLDSTDSASPVKRLITMYNANGLAASKAMRRATALAVEYQGECQRYVAKSVDEGTESDRWFHSAIDGLVDSEENTPTSESDDEDDWADSMYKSGDAGPLTTSETLSDFVRPPSLKAFDESAGETNEIVWEVRKYD